MVLQLIEYFPMGLLIWLFNVLKMASNVLKTAALDCVHNAGGSL